MYDVAIAGAGPAGSYAAYRLATMGWRVTVLESHEEPGVGVCCTGIVSDECYRRFILPAGVTAIPASSARVFGPDGRQVRVATDAVQAYIVDRPALNVALAAQAERAGARYMYGARVAGIARQRERCDATFNQSGREQVVTARTVIIATGLASSLPAKLGFPRMKHCATAAQAIVESRVEETEIYLDPELAPGGFAWLVPAGQGRALAGIVTHRRAAARLRPYLEKFRSEGRITGESPVLQKALPMAVLHRTYGERVLVLGEAAGQVKPTTCGGVYTGILCADIAAATLDGALREGDLSARRLAAYERGWRSLIGADLERGHWLRRFYDRLDREQVERLIGIIEAERLHEEVLARPDFSFDWHGRLFASLLGRPSLLRGILKPRTIFSVPALMLLAKSVR